MKKAFFLLLFLFLCLGVTAQSLQDRKEILTILNRQETDWNRGDIASFMVGYWESDSLSFTGASGISYGYKPVYENYKRRYPDRTSMGKLKFDVIVFRFLSDGVAQMIGKFSLLRPEKGDLTGHFTLIWQKIDGKWVITSDHTSG